MTEPVVVLSSAKDLVLLLKSRQPRFFRPAAFRMTPSTYPRSFGHETGLRMTGPLVVLSNAKDLGVCFGPERSCSVILSVSEESRT